MIALQNHVVFCQRSICDLIVDTHLGGLVCAAAEEEIEVSGKSEDYVVHIDSLCCDAAACAHERLNICAEIEVLEKLEGQDVKSGGNCSLEAKLCNGCVSSNCDESGINSNLIVGIASCCDYGVESGLGGLCVILECKICFVDLLEEGLAATI